MSCCSSIGRPKYFRLGCVGLGLLRFRYFICLAIKALIVPHKRASECTYLPYFSSIHPGTSLYRTAGFHGREHCSCSGLLCYRSTSLFYRVRFNVLPLERTGTDSIPPVGLPLGSNSSPLSSVHDKRIQPRSMNPVERNRYLWGCPFTTGIMWVHHGRNRQK